MTSTSGSPLDGHHFPRNLRRPPPPPPIFPVFLADVLLQLLDSYPRNFADSETRVIRLFSTCVKIGNPNGFRFLCFPFQRSRKWYPPKHKPLPRGWGFQRKTPIRHPASVGVSKPGGLRALNRMGASGSLHSAAAGPSLGSSGPATCGPRRRPPPPRCGPRRANSAGTGRCSSTGKKPNNKRRKHKQQPKTTTTKNKNYAALINNASQSRKKCSLSV